MNFHSEQIELITRQVLRELVNRGLTVPSSVAPNSSAKLKKASVLSGVVTHSVLEECRPLDIVRLTKDAVITPSGHDFIRKHGLTVQRDTEEQTTSQTVGCIVSSQQALAMYAAGNQLGWLTKSVQSDLQVTSIVRDFRFPVACCVEHPSMVACQLNRSEDMRAAVVTHQINFDALLKVMNPNVVCLNPAGWSFNMGSRLLKGLQSATERVCS